MSSHSIPSIRASTRSAQFSLTYPQFAEIRRSPGTINTPMGRQEASQQKEMQTMLELTPLQREGEASEIATAVAFLLSDDASYISGIDLRVDGGTVANLEKVKQ
ncbi:SDR family oxidoreductase [Candidatus Kurthia intestinigallinarum]